MFGFGSNITSGPHFGQPDSRAGLLILFCQQTSLGASCKCFETFTHTQLSNAMNHQMASNITTKSTKNTVRNSRLYSDRT